MTVSNFLCWGAIGAALLGAAPAADASRAPRPLTVDHVVILMRHGVRPPTKSPPLPEHMAALNWPAWPVPPGWLTPHGAEALRRIGAVDRRTLQANGVLPKSGCPKTRDVAIIADSDQRTIATAQVWIDAVMPGCGVVSTHKPQGVADPLFSGIENHLAPYDPERGDAAVRAAAGPGGFARLDRRYRSLVRRLDTILCGKNGNPVCGIGREPSGVRENRDGGRPKLSGMLDHASTAAQSILLEYADGKPMAKVGWGRASARDIERMSAFHALEFQMIARPRPVAKANFAGLAKVIARGLTGPEKLTVISGHDTNIANLAGLLDVHWQVPGLAADDPSPGGAIVLTGLHDAQGHRFVRVEYRSQTLPQIRAARVVGNKDIYRRSLKVRGCIQVDRCDRAYVLGLIAP